MDWTGGLDWWTGLVDWTGGLDWWTGLVDWTGGLDWWTGLDWTSGLALNISERRLYGCISVGRSARTYTVFYFFFRTGAKESFLLTH